MNSAVYTAGNGTAKTINQSGSAQKAVLNLNVYVNNYSS